MSAMTLVLAPWMAPMRVVRWETSIVDVYLGKVDVLESYEATASSPSVTLRVPAVTRVRRHLAPGKKDTKFSRSNVYARDGHRCLYCGAKKRPRDLTYDHVVPRVQGGATTWENIATACHRCNGQKGGRTPAQAGMRLLRQPEKPSWLPLTTGIALPREVPALWRPYLEGYVLAEAG